MLFQDVEPYNQLEIKTLWMQEVLAHGILSFGTHNISYAHNEEDIDKLIGVYGEVFPLIKQVVENKELQKYLRCEPIKPLFKVRN